MENELKVPLLENEHDVNLLENNLEVPLITTLPDEPGDYPDHFGLWYNYLNKLFLYLFNK
jgi:hypothetical protein